MKHTNLVLGKKLSLLWLFLVIFTSCQKEESIATPLEFGEIVNMHNDELAHSFGRLLAISVESSDVKNFVKDEVTKQFDGDYDMLLTMNLDKQAQNNRGRSVTFREMLKNAAPNGRTENIDDLIDQIQLEYPLLQVSIPELDVMSADNWDLENHTPIVAVLDHDYDDQNTSNITAYDSEGNSIELDAINEPDQLVIVVSPSERVIAISNIDGSSNGRTQNLIDIGECEQMQALAPIHSDDEYVFYDRVEYINTLTLCGGGGTGGGGSTGGTGSGCDRETNNEYDFINKAKFKDYGTLRQVETWVAGKPEVRLIVFFAYSNSTSNFNFRHLSYAMGEDDWFERDWLLREETTVKHFDYRIVRWDPDIYGDRMYYSWIEEDPSVLSGSLNVNVTSTFNFLNFNIANVDASGSASFSIGGADDVISSPNVVEFCDNTDGEGMEYGTPMRFWVNQQ